MKRMRPTALSRSGLHIWGSSWRPRKTWRWKACCVLGRLCSDEPGRFCHCYLCENALAPKKIADYAGWHRFAWTSAYVVLSCWLAGIPPLLGSGKLYVFAADQQGNVACDHRRANSVISLYYYFNVTRLMYFVKRVSNSRRRYPGPAGR